MNDLTFNFSNEEYELLSKLTNLTAVNADDWTLKKIARKIKDAYDNRRFIPGKECPYFEIFVVGEDCGKYGICRFCEICKENNIYLSIYDRDKLALIWKEARNALYDLTENNLSGVQDRLREIMAVADESD